MRTISAHDKIEELGGSLPGIEWFEEMGNLTALRLDKRHGFYRSNYSRGPLLYSLVTKYRPNVLLEFGTGRGYGTVCMARSLVDNSIDGEIFTVDTISGTDCQPWPIDRGSGPVVETLAANDVWDQYFEIEWQSRITRLTGASATLLTEWESKGLPNPDFSYIDAGHRFEEVRHDFYAFLSIAAPQFTVVFDDYVSRRGFGVKRLIDTEVAPVFDCELVQTEWRPGAQDSNWLNGGMVVADSRSGGGGLGCRTIGRGGSAAAHSLPQRSTPAWSQRSVQAVTPGSDAVDWVSSVILSNLPPLTFRTRVSVNNEFGDSVQPGW